MQYCFFCKTTSRTTWIILRVYPSVKTKIRNLSSEFGKWLFTLQALLMVKAQLPHYRRRIFEKMVVQLAPTPSLVNFFCANAEEEEMRKFSVFRIRNWNDNTVILFDGTWDDNCRKCAEQEHRFNRESDSSLPSSSRCCRPISSDLGRFWIIKGGEIKEGTMNFWFLLIESQ